MSMNLCKEKVRLYEANLFGTKGKGKKCHSQLVPVCGIMFFIHGTHVAFSFSYHCRNAGLYGFTSPHFSFSDHCKISILKVVDCRICGDPHSVLRFAFIEFSDEGKCTQVTTPILSNI